MSGFTKEDEAGLEARSVEGDWGRAIASGVEDEIVDANGVLVPVPLSNVPDIADDEVAVEVDNCSGFANANGGRKAAEEVVVGALGALG